MRGMVHTIVFQRQTNDVDGSGQQIRTWTDMGSSFASIKPVTGREYFIASGERAEVTHEIHLRARDDISPTAADRLLFGSRYFNIRSVINKFERNREWILMCTETMNDPSQS